MNEQHTVCLCCCLAAFQRLILVREPLFLSFPSGRNPSNFLASEWQKSNVSHGTPGLTWRRLQGRIGKLSPRRLRGGGYRRWLNDEGFNTMPVLGLLVGWSITGHLCS